MSSSMLHRIILASILALSIPAWAGDLPDPTLTPGANNPDVTQSNIQQTICVKGYTKTIRPPVAYTNKLKKRQIRQYGYADRNPKHYEEDHLIALEIGGAPKSPDIPRKILGLKVVATGQEKEKSAFCNSKVLKRVCL